MICFYGVLECGELWIVVKCIGVNVGGVGIVFIFDFLGIMVGVG